MSKPPRDREDHTGSSEYVVVKSEDVEDGRLVAGNLRALQREVRHGFDLVTNKLMTSLERIESKLDDLADRVGRLERDTDDHRKRLDALEVLSKGTGTTRLRARK